MSIFCYVKHSGKDTGYLLSELDNIDDYQIDLGNYAVNYCNLSNTSVQKINYKI